PSARMRAAGFALTGPWSTGENLAWASVDGGSSDMEQARGLHTQLMDSPPHRENQLNGLFQVVGLSFRLGAYEGYEAAFVTADFARSGEGQFLTGVAFPDRNKDRFYEPGEGLGGIAVTAVAGDGTRYSTITYAAGGYRLALPRGRYLVTFSGPGIAASSTP